MSTVDWPDRVAEELGLTPLTPQQVATVLDLARDVAHGTERRYAPLTTFLAGLAAGESSLDEVAERITALLDA